MSFLLSLLLLDGRSLRCDYTRDVFLLRFQDEIPRASLKLLQMIEWGTYSLQPNEK